MFKNVYLNSFFTRTPELWNSLPSECFRLTYDLNGLKPRLKGALSCLRRFVVTEIPLKMVENAFCFTQNISSFSRYLSFCFDILVM